MKVALIGFTGRVGSRILAELLRRGHTVTGVARDVTTVTPQPGVVVKNADATNVSQLASLLAGHDAVISASTFVSSNPKALIAATKQVGVRRLLVVGGAGTLEVAPGKALMDTPDFPDAYKPEAIAGCDPAARRVHLSDGAELAYDYLIVAAGAGMPTSGTTMGSGRAGTEDD